jgi:hypothetical protein
MIGDEQCEALYTLMARTRASPFFKNGIILSRLSACDVHSCGSDVLLITPGGEFDSLASSCHSRLNPFLDTQLRPRHLTRRQLETRSVPGCASAQGVS